MFDMETTGRKISEARKAANMTQLELADRLNISFQAVSNWERGNSMPDISKLPEISDILGISVDELLGKQVPILENLILGNANEYLDRNNVTVSELAEIAPLLKPSQMDDIFTKAEPTCDLSQIEDLLPFLGRDIIDSLFTKILSTDNINDASELAPFASRNIINEALLKRAEQNKSVGDLVIFADNAIKDELALKLYEKSGIGSLDDYLPFVSNPILQKIADEEYQKSGLKHFESIAPFIDRGYLNEIAKKAIEKDGIKAISPIAPFLDRNMLNEYVKEKYL